MSLPPLQRRIVALLKERRSCHSFVGGSAVFNETYPRISDDLDIFAEDRAIAEIAAEDIEALQRGGLRVVSRVDHYGFAIEAEISDGAASTLVEWSEADRERFFPIAPHETFGWALHKSDLAIQKLIAAATRRKARDSFDLALIDARYMPLAIAALAAPAKFPGVSPITLLERARMNAMGLPAADFEAMRRDAEAAALTAGEIKCDFADRIQRAIDALAELSPAVAPGRLYIDPETNAPILPTAATLPRLVEHRASSRGAIPRIIGPGEGRGR